MSQTSSESGQHSAPDYSGILRSEINKICVLANVFQGVGPPFAYFDVIARSPSETARYYIYDAFMMGLKKAEGAIGQVDESPWVVIGETIKRFREWLQPNRTLVWRAPPEIETDGHGKWTSYYRCVQIDDNAREFMVSWRI